MKAPAVVAHADWSLDPRKRWMAVAKRGRDGRYRLRAPQLVGDATTLPQRLQRLVPGGTVLLGVDFPLGVPAAWAARAGISHFGELLRCVGHGRWSAFYEVASTPAEISLYRPFYPRRPGGARRRHISDALGLQSEAQLFRRCDGATPTRPAASPLFFTLGAKQVGKAALTGWRELLVPALPHGLRMWPFDGGLAELLEAPGFVVAEAYPAELYRHLELSFPPTLGGKRAQAARAHNAAPLLAAARRLGVTVTGPMRAAIVDGFGASSDGEDPFDATAGVLGTLNVAFGHRDPGDPRDRVTREIEGWILGQSHGETAVQ